jgi:hypothetical protein
VNKLSFDIQLIIGKLNKLLNNLKKYQDKSKDIINSYNKKCTNYQVIHNTNEYMKQNNKISTDLNDIIHNDNIAIKLVSLINLYYKFNKNEQVGYQKKKEKESENTNEITEIYEINEEKNYRNYSKKKLFDYDLEY